MIEEPLTTARAGAASLYIISSDCMNCGICEHMCPLDAIVEAKHQLIILKRICNGCGLCTPYCPVQAIVPKHKFRERQAHTVNEALRRVLDPRNI